MKIIYKFHDNLSSELFYVIALQYQNDFALPRYLLFYSVANISPDDLSVSHSTIQPTIKPILNPASNFVNTLPTTAAEPSTFRSTPDGAVGPLKTKTTNRLSVFTQHTRGLSNYDAESHIRNIET